MAKTTKTKKTPATPEAATKSDPSLLAKSCMLVILNVSTWSARKQDAKMTKGAAQSVGAQEDRARGTKYLIDPKAISTANSIASRLRTMLYTKTLPWLDDGTRVLPNGLYFDFLQTIKPVMREMDDEADKIERNWSTLVTEGKAALGSAVADSDYPTNIRERYGVRLRFLPFPEATDFRLDGLNASAQEEIRNSMATVADTIAQQARTEMAGRVKDVVVRIVKRLQAYERKMNGSTAAGDRVPFGDDLITNARELVGLLDSLNVANDPDISAITGALDKLSAVEPEALRQRADLRAQAIADAQAITATIEKQMGDFI
jgi:hypothetical protein